MKKKLILMSAALAAVATFTGCSSDDDVLAQGQEPVAQKKGTPFSVVVTDETGTTRATLIDGTTLTNFKLYGKQGTNTPWINGNVFKLEDSKWNPYAGTTLVEMSWPTEDTETASNFYAYSDNSADGITVAATPTTSCVTTDNLANGSFVYQFYTDPNEHTLAGGVGKTSVALDGNTVIDLSKQSDILVASTTQNEATGTTVPLNFRHALASLCIKARFLSTYKGNSQGVNANAIVRIYWIRIHGLKGGGTFTFPATDNYDTSTHRWGTSPWTTTGGSDVVYEWKFVGDDDVMTKTDVGKDVPAQAHTAEQSDKDIVKTELIPHAQLMVIPQTFTPWADITSATQSNCYVEICCAPNAEATRPRRAVYYLPLKNSGNEILTGVKHTITLPLEQIVKSTGGYYFEPTTFNE